MNRRDLFKLLPAVSAVFVTLPESSLMGADNHRGFKLWWSGWQRPIEHLIFIGNWIAQNPKKDHWDVYSAYPGVTDKAYPGQMMNLSIQENQELPRPTSTEKELGRFQFDAYLRLIAYIDAHYEELTK